MSRPTQPVRTKIIVFIVVAVAIAIGMIVDIKAHSTSISSTSSVVQAPTTQITYRGQDGQSALTLLKKHARVQTKSSSLGEYVTSINGNDGGGKKYWIFYVNGKESQVGAGSYMTHNGDVIQWKLQ